MLIGGSYLAVVGEATLYISIESTVPTEVNFMISYENGQVLQTGSARVHEGKNTIATVLAAGTKPIENYVITISSKDDSSKDNNHYLLCRQSSGKNSIFTIGANQEYLQTLRLVLGDQVEVSEYVEGSDVNSCSLMIIVDPSVLGSGSQDDFWEQVRENVSDGMGVLTYSSDGINNLKENAGNIFYDLLPVKVVRDNKGYSSDNAVVFIIDTSGSMEQERVSLAREVVLHSLARLENSDMLGIVEFYGRKNWAVSLQPVSNKLAVNRALSKLTPGGGTVFLPALEEAHFALLNSDCSVKHIVLISDGGLEQGDYKNDFIKVREDNITISTILVGSGLNLSFMMELANIGGGAFFHIKDRMELPGVNFKEVFNDPGDMEAKNIGQLKYQYGYELLENIDLNGLKKEMKAVKCLPYPGSQTLLSYGDNQPLLTFSLYGLGKSAFCASDMFLNNLQDYNTAKLFGGLCNMLIRDPGRPDNIQLRMNNNILELEYYNPVLSKEDVLNFDIAKGGMSQRYRLYYVDGLWRGSVKISQSGIYEISIVNEDVAIDGISSAVNVKPEINSVGFNELVHRKLADFGIGETTNSHVVDVIKPLWLYFAIAGLISFIAGVFLRRISYGNLLSKRCNNSAVSLIILVILLSSSSMFAADNTENIQPDARSCNAISFINGVKQNLDDNGQVIAVNSYVDAMLYGYELYFNGQYDTAVDIFHKSALLAVTSDDMEYSAAWAFTAAVKCDRSRELISEILTEPKLAVVAKDQLLLIASLNGWVKELETLEYWVSESDISDKQRKEFSDKIYRARLDLGVETSLDMSADRFISSLKYCIKNKGREQAAVLLNDFVENEGEGLILIEIAEEISHFGFIDEAFKMLDLIMPDKACYYQAQLCRSTLKERAGDPDGMLKCLLELSENDSIAPGQMASIADILRGKGYNEQAKKVLESLYKRTQSVDLLIKVAEIADDTNDKSSYGLWLDLWRKSTDKSRLNYLKPRLLASASKTENLTKLVLWLEEQVCTGKDSDKYIDMLVSIYESVGDPVGVIEIVKEYYGTDSLRSLQMQNRIYYRTRHFSYCIKVLEKLLEIDPENYDNYLYQLALATLENNRPGDTYDIIEYLQNYDDGSVERKLFIAGLYKILKMYGNACDIFQELIDQKYESYDLWLSWVETAQLAGKRDAAMKVLSENLDSELSDTMFCVTVDSLLLLNANEDLLSIAYDKTVQRLAGHLNQSVYYKLASDILWEMNRSFDERALRLCLVSALNCPRQRITNLRDMLLTSTEMQVCDLDLLLLLLDCEVTDKYLLQYGMDFIDGGQYELASYFISRNIIPTCDVAKIIETINSLNRAGQFDLSIDVINEALVFHPDNILLLNQLGMVYEILGNFKRSFHEYYNCYCLLAARSKYEFDAGLIRIVDADITERLSALRGMIDTGDAKDISDLTVFISANISELVKEYEAVKQKDQLYSYLYDLDRIYLASGDLQSSITLYKSYRYLFNEQDHKFKQKLLEHRFDFNVIGDTSYDVGKMSNVDVDELLLTNDISILDCSCSKLRHIDKLYAQGKANDASDQLKDLILNNKIESESVFYRCVAYCVILNKKEYVLELINNYIVNYVYNKIQASQGKLEDTLLASVFKICDIEDFNEICAKLKTQYYDNPELLNIVELYQAKKDPDYFYSSKLALDYILSQSDIDYKVLASIVPLCNSADRGGLVKKCLDKQTEDVRGTFLINYIKYLPYIISGNELLSYLGIISGLSELKPTANNYYGDLVKKTSVFFHNYSIVKAVCDKALELEPDRMDYLCFARIVSRYDPYEPQLDESYNIETVDMLFNLDPSSGVMSFLKAVEDIVGLLSQETANELLINYESSKVSTNMNIFQFAILLELSYQCGDMERLSKYALECYNIMPEDHVVFQYLNERMAMCGRVDLLVDAMSKYLDQHPEGNTFFWRYLFRLSCSIGNYKLAEYALRDEASTLYVLNSIYLEYARDDRDKLKQLFRKAIVDTRCSYEKRNYKWVDWQEKGGISGYLDSKEYKLFGFLATCQCLKDDFLRYAKGMSNDLVYDEVFSDFIQNEKIPPEGNSFVDIMEMLIKWNGDNDGSIYQSFSNWLESNPSQEEKAAVVSIISSSDSILFVDKFYELKLRLLYLAGDKDGVANCVNWIVSSIYSEYSPDLSVQIIKYYLMVGDETGLERNVLRLLTANDLKIPTVKPGNLLQIEDELVKNKADLIDRAAEITLDYYNNNPESSSRAVKYLSMLTVLKYKAGGSCWDLLDKLNGLSGAYVELRLWYLDVLTLCGYTREAENEYNSLRAKGVMPYSRLKNGGIK